MFQEIHGGLGSVLRLIKVQRFITVFVLSFCVVLRVTLAFPPRSRLLPTPPQRDGYFYVTQGEKSLANQTHAGDLKNTPRCIALCSRPQAP